MRRRKTGSDPIQNQIKLLITSLEAAVDFASGMLESYEDGEMEYAEEDAENFESYIQRLQDDHEMVVKAFKKRSRMASRRRAAYNDPCDSMSYDGYLEALVGLQECHKEKINERDVESAWEYMQDLINDAEEAGYDWEFPDVLEEASSKNLLNDAEHELLKWYYDHEY